MTDKLKLPTRKGLISVPMPKNAEKINSVVVIGGYHYWNWKFPFRHFEQERLMVATRNSIYEVTL